MTSGVPREKKDADTEINVAILEKNPINLFSSPLPFCGTPCGTTCPPSQKEQNVMYTNIHSNKSLILQKKIKNPKPMLTFERSETSQECNWLKNAYGVKIHMEDQQTCVYLQERYFFKAPFTSSMQSQHITY